MKPFGVENYSIDNFLEILSSADVNDLASESVKSKLHTTFFREYFDHTNAKTIVIEYEYVDRDYLEDFSAYYVRSFKPYKRFCTRLHFFSLAFNVDDFTQILVGKPDKLRYEDLYDNYLGFIVIKPLPQTLIGKTCLITYEEEGKRNYPFIRKYKVSLFGLNLDVKTIAFQEQDSIVAACASSAIWVAFQATGKLFQHEIPSPVEITKAATKNIPYADRYFPNKGLNPEQIAHAIRSQRLEPLLIEANKVENLKTAVFAYLNAKIPLILGASLYERDKVGAIKLLGHHAITITGFCLGDKYIDEFGVGFYLTSSRIIKLYVHDDQVGPFARLSINGDEIDYSGKKIKVLASSWFDDNREIGNVFIGPKILIVPLYHKIRIPFNQIIHIGYQFNKLYNTIRDKYSLPYIFWGLTLTQVTDLKESIYNHPKITPAKRYELLTKPLPRFIWKLNCCIIGLGELDFLFDATDIDQGNHYILFIEYENHLRDYLRGLFKVVDLNLIEDSNVKAIIKDLRDH